MSKMQFRVFGPVLCLFLSEIGAGAQEPAQTNASGVVDSLKSTNNVEVAEAVSAMAVEESDEAVEAAEVAQAMRRAELEKAEQARKDEPVNPWDAFAPPLDTEYDWIQLTSREWLKGDFRVMYDFTVEFDSDELGLQEFDLDDVKRLRTRSMKTVLIEGEETRWDTNVLRGQLIMDEKQIILRRSEHEVTIPRERVISIAGGRQREWDYWSGEVSFGGNVRSGNTETEDITLKININRRTARTRFHLDYLANYSTTKDVQTANNSRLSGFADIFLTSHFYWKAIEGEHFRDPFSNIDAQYSVSTGPGYDIIRTPQIEWTVSAGVGYQELRFVSVQPGEDDSSSSPFGTLATRLDYELTENVDLLYDYSLRILNEINGKYTHHMLGTVSFDLIGDLDLDISIIWDRVEQPQKAADGTTPDQNDYQLIVSLAYEF